MFFRVCWELLLLSRTLFGLARNFEAFLGFFVVRQGVSALVIGIK